MDVTELLATIQNEPAAAVTRIEEALQAALTEGGEGAAEGLLEELATGCGETAQAEALLKALDGTFRRHRESELGRVTAPPPAKAEAYARTEHTSGWVKLPQSAEDLMKEADKVAP